MTDLTTNPTPTDKPDAIEARLYARIERITGPEIHDPMHVIAWTVADGAWLKGTLHGIEFGACSGHADPDQCDPDCAAPCTLYRAEVHTADLDNDDWPEHLAAALKWAAEQYRQCIVSARATTDSGHYEKCNGRAEAYRQLADQVAAATGLARPDWDGIRQAVPADGIYRHG